MENQKARDFFYNSRGSSWPLALDARFQTFGYCSHRSVSCDFKDNFLVLVIFPLPPWKWWGINFHEPLKWKVTVNEDFHVKSSVLLFMTIVFICNILLRELMLAKYRKCINFLLQKIWSTITINRAILQWIYVNHDKMQIKCYSSFWKEIVTLCLLEFSCFELIGTGVSKYVEVGSRLWKSKRLWQSRGDVI